MKVNKIVNFEIKVWKMCILYLIFANGLYSP